MTLSTFGGFFSPMYDAAKDLFDKISDDAALRGRAMTVTPQGLGELAFIKIDQRSAGGRYWGQAFGEDTLNFAFIDGEEFTDSVSANYSEKEVLGRSESYLVYGNTANREIPISLIFHAQGLPGQSYEESLEREVRRKVDWCRALCYPYYTPTGRMYPPPAVYFLFGRMFTRQGVPLRGVVESTEVTFNGPFSTATLASHAAGVSMQFKCATDGHDLPSTTLIGRGRF